MLAVVLIALGVGSYRYLVSSLQEQEVDRLRAIGDLKAQWLAAWYGERMADARVSSRAADRPVGAVGCGYSRGGAPGARWSRCSRLTATCSIELFDRDGVRVSVAGADLKGPNLLTGALDDAPR